MIITLIMKRVRLAKHFPLVFKYPSQQKFGEIKPSKDIWQNK